MDTCKLNNGNGCRKISSKVEVRDSSGSLVSSGNVTAISKSCMCVNTNHRIPENSTIKMRNNKNVLEISVRIERSQYINCNYKLCVEVLNPPLDYIAFTKKHY